MISSISGTGSLNRSSFAQMRQQMFNRIDTDGDGKVSKDELTQMVANGPTGGPSVDELLKQSDTDGDGYVSQSEFEAVTKDRQKMQGGPPPMAGGMGDMSSADFVKQMFSNIDTDGDGKVSKDELTQMVANGPTGGPSVDELLKQSDTDGDGYVSQSEFEAAVSKGPQAQNQGGLNVDDAFSALDADGDGTISKSEFDGFFTQTTDSAQGSDSENKLWEKLLGAFSDAENSAASTSGAASDKSSINLVQMLSAALSAYQQSGINGSAQGNFIQNFIGSGLSLYA